MMKLNKSKSKKIFFQGAKVKRINHKPGKVRL